MRLLRFTILFLLAIGPVFADTISIGLQEGGGSPTIVATGTGLASFSGAFGTFSDVTVAGNGVTKLTTPDLLFADNITTATAQGGVINIFVTDQGLTDPLGSLLFESGFTSNLLPAGWTLTESTFVSPTNALFTGTPLSSASFSAIGTSVQTAPGTTGAGPYSITEEFIIRATGAGDANNTIDLSAETVAEPSPLFLLGFGLVGIGFLARRLHVSSHLSK